MLCKVTYCARRISANTMHVVLQIGVV